MAYISYRDLSRLPTDGDGGTLLALLSGEVIYPTTGIVASHRAKEHRGTGLDLGGTAVETMSVSCD